MLYHEQVSLQIEEVQMKQHELQSCNIVTSIPSIALLL